RGVPIAEDGASARAIEAAAAVRAEREDDVVAAAHVRDAGPDLVDDAGGLVPEHHGQGQGPVAVDDVPVAVADARRHHAHAGLAETCPAAAPEHVLRKIQDLPASIAILAPDQYYRGYTLVVSKTHATELYHLDERESTQYFRDMLRVAAAVAAAFRPRKMNYEVLGNTVAHLHWHLFPRYDEDPNPK